MKSRYGVVAAAALLVTYLGYFFWFHIIHDNQLSQSTSDWALFGDFFGGVLGPIFAFISVVLLIESLLLQNEANRSLKNQLKNSELTEKSRAFEALFFGMINAQRDLFNEFDIHMDVKGSSIHRSRGEAVIMIEETIKILLENGQSKREITEFIKSIDSVDKIYGLLRSFYVISQLISDELSDSKGFAEDDRSARRKALINFTDFAQLRLILICIEYYDSTYARKLSSDAEVQSSFERVGLMLPSALTPSDI